MRFLPHTQSDIETMLAALGISRIEELIEQVPAGLRESAEIALPNGLPEADVAAALSGLAARNQGASLVSFLGGGAYRHYIPAAVRAIIGRAEFATSYTPYQPEASQGTTQAIFEFQTLITQLTGLEVANASMYDGASAAAEAVLMARRIMPRRSVVAMARTLWPDYRATIRTYISALEGIELVEIPFDPSQGSLDLAKLENIGNDRLLCTVTGYPNAFGIIESLDRVAEITHRAGALAISVTAEPLALGLLKSPGEVGIDIAVGEGQSFGIPLQFGGPGVGFMAARMAHLRQMPGRLVGQTRDNQGRRAFCLTLATREQHIRRERATSNICTNNSLCALAATAYLTMIGRRGLHELAARNVALAHEGMEALEMAGIPRRFMGKVFNEFVVAVPNSAKALADAERAGVLAGLLLARDYPEVADGILVTVTEMNTRTQIDQLRASFGE